MIKSGFLLLTVALTAAATAQIGPPIPIVFPGVPSGACSPPNLAVNTSNGDFYTCSAGVWVKVSGGAGGLSGQTPGQVPKANSATTANSSIPIQGTDGSLLSSGTVSGTSVLLCTDANGGATTTSCPTGGSPGGATTQVQTNTGGVFTGDATFTHSNATGETDVANLSSVRFVTPSYKFTYTDSGGSLGNLTSAGAGLVVTLPCTSNAPCPRGIDTSLSPITAGTGGISSGLTTVTMATGSINTLWIGLVIKIPGAGPAGGVLTSTIVSWTDATHVTIATPASATVSGQTITIGSYIYTIKVSGTGTTEAAIVTGGTCTALATASCTLIISTQFAHANGYTLSSASDGIQEAINDGWTNNIPFDATSANAPHIKLMSSTQYNVYGTIYLRGWGAVLDGTDALIGCFTRDYCIFAGGTYASHPGSPYQRIVNPFMVPGLSNIVGCNANPWCSLSSVSSATGIFTFTTSSNHSFHGATNGVGADVIDCEWSTTGNAGHFAGKIQNVTANTFDLPIEGATVFSAGAYTFGFCRPLTSGIENNTTGLVLDNLQMQQVNSVNSSASAWFGFGVVNENDQRLVVNAATNRGQGVIDTSDPVSAFFYQRTDRGLAGIYNITNSEISNVNCFTGGGNGMIWRGGVCQAFPVFGIRYFGGLQPATIQDLYQESGGGINNPLYGYAASMAYLFSGGNGQRFLGTFPTGGQYPVFPCSGTAQAQRNYYVQAVDGSLHAGPMNYIGSSQANCAGATITVKWPSVMGVDSSGAAVTGPVTWNLAVTSGTGTVPPFSVAGANNVYLLFQSAVPTCDSTGMCTYADVQGATSSHSLAPLQFLPKYWFWPSPFVSNGTVIYADIAGTRPGIITSSGASKVSLVAAQCISAGDNTQLSQAIIQCGANPNAGNFGTNAELFPQDGTNGYAPVNSKGMWNWGFETGLFPVDLWTIADANFSKTGATSGNRPTNDTQDIAIGEDQAGGYSTRSYTSISNYINTVNDNAAFLERLTATSKTIKVPLVAGGTAAGLTGTGACATFSGQVGGKWAGSAACASATAASTLTITPGLTAPNGWICSVYDETTRANLFQQTSHTTTTCVLTATSVTQNDVFVFSAIAY